MTTTLIVPVPAAEPLVAGRRRRWDPSAMAGVPAHVTVLHPFKPIDGLTPAVLARLRQVCAMLPRFGFDLRRVGRFDGAVVYLAPEPAEPFRAMTRALAEHFPDCPPYGGVHADIVPHLTVAHTSSALALDRVATDLARRLNPGIYAEARAVTLLARSAGRWHPHSALPLGR